MVHHIYVLGYISQNSEGWRKFSHLPAIRGNEHFAFFNLRHYLCKGNAHFFHKQGGPSIFKQKVTYAADVRQKVSLT